MTLLKVMPLPVSSQYCTPEDAPFITRLNSLFSATPAAAYFRPPLNLAVPEFVSVMVAVEFCNMCLLSGLPPNWMLLFEPFMPPKEYESASPLPEP